MYAATHALTLGTEHRGLKARCAMRVVCSLACVFGDLWLTCLRV